MVGANYMGGKRNTARAKSRDIVGRAQRRHFGRQRLALALCATHENRVYPSAPTLSSVLPEITLGHARSDSGMDSTTASRKVSNEDTLHTSTSPRNTTQRNKPSKVLGVLDVSDHMSIRAAIDRILQQPDLVGICDPELEDTAYIERSPVLVRRQTEAHPDPADDNSDVPDQNTQHSQIALKRAFDSPVSYPHTTDSPNSIDLLFDPHPWETIGRILNLESPEASAAQPMKISFTRDREGVGYVSPERPGTCKVRSPSPTFGPRIDGRHTGDIHVADTHVAFQEVPAADDCDTPDSTSPPLLDAASPFITRDEIDHVDEFHCTKNEFLDTTFDGPCLFDDSDFEEEEEEE